MFGYCFRMLAVILFQTFVQKQPEILKVKAGKKKREREERKNSQSAERFLILEYKLLTFALILNRSVMLSVMIHRLEVRKMFLFFLHNFNRFLPLVLVTVIYSFQNVNRPLTPST